MTAPPVLLGLYVGARRRLMESLRERADSLERELQLLAERAEERAEWARNEERTRIAREMHDVVAHRVSLMVVHAAALQAVARKDPEKAVRNAALVGDMGRQALTELREMLGVLRTGDGLRAARAAVGAVGGGGGGRGGGGFAGRGRGREGPCLAELEELIGQSAAAGMVVDLSVEGEVRAYARGGGADGVPGGAGGVDERPQACGGGEDACAAGASGGGDRDAGGERAAAGGGGGVVGAVAVGGNGLVGMKERVVGAGGRVRVGADGCGGFSGVGGDSGGVRRSRSPAGRGRRAPEPRGLRSDPSGPQPAGEAGRFDAGDEGARAWSMSGPRYQSPVWSRA